MDEVNKLIKASETRIKREISGLKSHVTAEARDLKNAVASVARHRPVVSATIFAIGFGVGMAAAAIALR